MAQNDFFFFGVPEPERAAEMVVDIVAHRVPRTFTVPPADIQVLSPMHRGATGVRALNEKLQAALNPLRYDRPEYRTGNRVLRTGDKVMQIRNNYDKDIFNGDIGFITTINLEEGELSINFDDRQITYDFTELDEITLAYAITVHKSQGSEYPVVVLPLLTQHYIMLQRNLLYTAITRAQKMVVIVGSRKAIGMAIKNNKITARWSALRERLQTSSDD